MAEIELPRSPLAHHYLVSDIIPQIAELDFEIPMMVVLEGFAYLHQEQKGVLLGIYEIDHRHWMEDGASWDYGIERELEMGFNRYLCCRGSGLRPGLTAHSASRPMATRWLGQC